MFNFMYNREALLNEYVDSAGRNNIARYNPPVTIECKRYGPKTFRRGGGDYE